MKVNASILECVQCRGSLKAKPTELTCSACDATYPIINEIPRFVPMENYSHTFGFQWQKYRKTQIDKFNGLDVSHERFYRQTHWSQGSLRDKKVLECGSGAGRFTQVLCETGAEVHSVDYSEAVEANYENNKEFKNLHLYQASIYDLPFQKEYFDRLICFGVLQHTPDVEKTFKVMFQYLKAGGEFCFDVYASPLSYLHPRHLLRPITKRMNKERLHGMVEKVVPALLPLSDACHSVPGIGQSLARLVPVANWRINIPIKNPNLRREWAILDTFDWLSPVYENPQPAGRIKAWCKDLKLSSSTIERHRGLYVVRGIK